MCARYSLRPVVERFVDLFELPADSQIEAQPVVAPTNAVPVVLLRADGARGLRRFRWGLLALGDAMGTGHINARSESVFEKRAFREAASQRRCLMPATAFFEWGGEGKARRPYRFESSVGDTMAFAAIWSPPASPGWPATCCLLTTQPNELVAQVHDRMPVVLAREAHPLWLDPETPQEVLMGLCAPFAASQMVVAEATREETLPPRNPVGTPQGSLF